MFKELIYIPKKGRFLGKEHVPHWLKRGCYVVGKDKESEIDVKTLEEVYDYYKRGYHVRMSYNGNSASLITPSSIFER